MENWVMIAIAHGIFTVCLNVGLVCMICQNKSISLERKMGSRLNNLEHQVRIYNMIATRKLDSLTPTVAEIKPE